MNEVKSEPDVGPNGIAEGLRPWEADLIRSFDRAETLDDLVDAVMKSLVIARWCNEPRNFSGIAALVGRLHATAVRRISRDAEVSRARKGGDA